MNGLPFQGHRENINQETPNKGLFIEIVELVSKYDAVLAKHLAESNRYETYLSPIKVPKFKMIYLNVRQMKYYIQY